MKINAYLCNVKDNYLYHLLTLLFWLGMVQMAAAQQPERDADDDTRETAKRRELPTETVYAWQVDEMFADETPAVIDTSTVNYHEDTAPAHKRTIASEWLGNRGLPDQSAIFRDRNPIALKGDFLFRNNYTTYYKGASEALFYNTKIPYSNLTWNSGGYSDHYEDFLKGVLAVNANKRLSFSADINWNYGRGAYYNQSTHDVFGYLNGSYRGERYSVYFTAGLNNFKQYENGGIADASTMGGDTRSYNLNVRLSNAWSVYRSFYFWVNQQYALGRRETDPDDTDETRFVSMATLGYTLKFEGSRRKYYESAITEGFYEQNLYNDKLTRDTVSNNLMRNIFYVSLNEGFRKWAIFNIRAFAEVDVEQNMCLTGDSLYGYHNQALVSVGGEIARRKGITQFSALADVLLLGSEKQAGFEVKGDFSTKIRLRKDSMYIKADGFVRSTNPSYFANHYYSNHFAWDNRFSNTWAARGYGEIGIPNRICDFSLGAGWDGVKQLVYFNEQALPTQSDAFVQVISANAKFNLSVWWLHWENKVCYQYTSHPDVLPLPQLSLYTNLYLRHSFIKKVLTLQLGVDCRYNTAYYANTYMPATGVFYRQSDELVGNYPLMNLYLNIHVKHFRVYLMYYNLSSAFMKPTYFAVAGYPLNPGMFKFGLSWNFFN